MESERMLNPIIICNIFNHGHTYDEWSTSFIIGMSKISWVNNITLIVPPSNGGNEIILPKKCKVLDIMDYEKPLRMSRLVLKIMKIPGDPVIVVYGPTAFGSKSLSNLIGMLLPILISKIAHKNVKIINQGSVYTHDVESLGYDTLFDKLRKSTVLFIEKFVYSRIKTYFQLDYYKNIVSQKIGKKCVAGVIKSDYIDPIATLSINGMDSLEHISRNKKGAKINILLHGFWGPQKDPKVALEAISKLKKNYLNICLTVSGGINNHFPGYEVHFNNLLLKYDCIIDKYLGYVNEKDLVSLFLNNEIVLMPYRVSGGQSGVLEMASFFENIVVCTDLPEFREERKSDLIILTDLSNFDQSIQMAIERIDQIPQTISVSDKINLVIKNITDFLLD